MKYETLYGNFKDLEIVKSSYLRWIGNKHIGGQVFMLDGWEVRSYTTIPSP